MYIHQDPQLNGSLKILWLHCRSWQKWHVLKNCVRAPQAAVQGASGELLWMPAVSWEMPAMSRQSFAW